MAIELLNMDCMEYMQGLPDKAFDLAIVDPPYGINFAKKHTGKGWVVRDQKDWDKCAPGGGILNSYGECLKIKLSGGLII